MPTLLEKGSLVSINPKIKTGDLSEFVAIHYIIQLIKYKMTKSNPNMHDRLLMVKGLTGSGKTTILPIEINRAFHSTNDNIPNQSKEYRENINFNFSAYDFPDDKYTVKNRKLGITPFTIASNVVLCAQPTTILAKGKAQEIARASYNPDVELAVNMGYSTGTFKLFPKSPNSVLFCTMGTLSATLKNKNGHDEDIAQKYRYILVDECHEQSLEMIEGLLLLTKFLQRNAGNPTCPMVILMSATFDIKSYAEYFQTSPANSIIIEGEGSSRIINYLDKQSNDIYGDIANKVIELHRENSSDPDDHCDILVFIPGDGEINKTQKLIEAQDPDKEFYIGKITSEINQRGGLEVDYLIKYTLDELKTELKRPGIKRRVILATSVVETGLTIDTLKYCIDSCLAKYVIYFPVHNLTGLLVEQMAKSSAEQRAGRVGRTKPGIVYRMMEEKIIDRLDEYKRTDLYTTDVSKMVLDIMYIDVLIGDSKLLDNSSFQPFLKDCMNFVNCENVGACKNIYLYKMNKNNTQQFFNGRNINLYPNKLLDLMPTDVFIQARNKLYNLGFWGTYAGYVASKISRLSVESIRMILCGAVYGVSLADLIIIGLFVDSGNKSYKYTQQNKPKKMAGVAFYDTRKMIESVLDKSSVSKYYFGTIDDFHEELYDEFIEPLLIARWLAKNYRKYGPSKMDFRAKKYGLNFRQVIKILEPRNQIQAQFKKTGYLSIHNDIDFNSDTAIDNIVRIKQCIHAGFKHNVAYLDKNGIHYITNTGLKINPTNMKLRNRPPKIVFGSLFTTMNQMTSIYDPTPIYVSSMAGII